MKSEVTNGYGLIPSVVVFYNSVMLEQWWVFIRSDGRESYFLVLFSISKWITVAVDVLLNALIFIFVMAADFNHEKREILGIFVVVEVVHFMWMSLI